jgi:hypothetical protein
VSLVAAEEPKACYLVGRARSRNLGFEEELRIDKRIDAAPRTGG